jgi:hypothetical protein
MRAVEQWRAIEESLGGSWDDVDLAFTVEDPGSAGDAAAVLGPLGPGRSGRVVRLHVSGRGSDPERLRNLLERLDRKRLWGVLELVDASVSAPPEASDELAREPEKSRGLVADWHAAVAELPPGWSDLLCELELDSTDLVPRTALLGAPLNPTRVPGATALRFRVSNANRLGYGASAAMARRCLERMEEEGIRGRVRILEVLSDADNVATQGPVWRIAGRSV